MPDLCLGILGEGAAKPSLALLLRHVDAVIVRSRAILDHVQIPISACIFCLQDLSCPPLDLIMWLRGRIRAVNAQ